MEEGGAGKKRSTYEKNQVTDKETRLRLLMVLRHWWDNERFDWLDSKQAVVDMVLTRLSQPSQKTLRIEFAGSCETLLPLFPYDEDTTVKDLRDAVTAQLRHSCFTLHCGHNYDDTNKLRDLDQIPSTGDAVVSVVVVDVRTILARTKMGKTMRWIASTSLSDWEGVTTEDGRIVKILTQGDVFAVVCSCRFCSGLIDGRRVYQLMKMR